MRKPCRMRPGSALPTPRPLPRLAGSGARIGAARQPHRYGRRRGLTLRRRGRASRRQTSSLRRLVRRLPPRPPSLFRVPSAAAAGRFAPSVCHGDATRAHARGACMRTPYRDRHRPAARRCGLILRSARAAGLDGRCHPQAWWQPPAIRPGTVAAATLTAVAVRRPAHRPPHRKLLADRMRTPPFPCSQCGSRAASRRPAATRLATGSQPRRCFAAIPGPAPAAARRCGLIPMSARAAAVERGACRQAPGVRAHPARYGHRRFFPQRHHGGRRAVRHPHCAGLFRWQPSRPPPFSIPLCGSPAASRRGLAAISRSAPRVPSGMGTGFSLRSKPRSSRPARYTAVTADSCRSRSPMPRRCTRSRQRFGYSRRADTPFVMPVAHCAAARQAPGHPSLLTVRFPDSQRSRTRPHRPVCNPSV